MIRLPLFGKDSSPHRTSMFISAICTFVIWLVMILIFCFVPLKNKNQKYEVVQIVLDFQEEDFSEVRESEEIEENLDVKPNESSPQVLESQEVIEEQKEIENVEKPVVNQLVEEKIENPVVEEKIVEEKVVGNPIVEKKVVETKVEKIPEKVEKIEKNDTPEKVVKNQPEQEKKVEEKKVEPEKKNEGTPLEKQVHYELVKSNEELLAEQSANQQKKTYNDFDWDSMFGDTEDEKINKTTNEVAENRVTNSSSLSGNAGNVTEQINHQQKSENSAEKKADSKNNEDATKATKKSLEKIENASNADNFVDGDKKSDEKKSDRKNEVYNQAGNIKFQMDGYLRKFVKPEYPELKLSSEAQKNIENDITVKISFNIQKNGHVLESDISFDKKSILSPIVQKEIKEQISSWVFEQSDEISRATFDYSIKIRK